MSERRRRTTLAIDGETFEALAAVAHRNERSASAEGRLAIRLHVPAGERPMLRTPDGLPDGGTQASPLTGVPEIRRREGA